MIKEWVSDLLTLSDADWGAFSFSRDPLLGKVPPEQRLSHWQKARESAQALARGVAQEQGDRSPLELARRLKVQVVYAQGESAEAYTMYAAYQEPDKITIYARHAEAADHLIHEEQLGLLPDGVHTAEVLIAHELYHYLEQTTPGVYSVQKHLTLWRLGPLENRSRILCLEEVGAMAFAQELLGLISSPYILEVVMLYDQSPNRAGRLHQNMMKFHGAWEER
jgi:hypothetical protein